MVQSTNCSAVVRQQSSYISVVHHEKQPLDSSRRWSAKENKYIDVQRPLIVQAYNAYMGDVDMAD